MKSLLYLNRFFLKYKYRLIFGTLFVSISNLFAIYPAEILRKGIDLVYEGIGIYNLFAGSSIIASVRSDYFNLLLIFGLVVLATALLKGLFMFFMRQTIIVMSRLMEFDLKNEIFQHYQKLDLGFYKKNKTGDLMNRISEDVSQVRMYLGPAIMYAISTVTLFVLVFVKMISINAELTLYVLTPMPVLALTIYLINSLVIKRSEAVQRQLSTISSFVQESFSGIRVIKAYNKERFTRETFQKETDLYRNKNLDLVKINALFYPMIIMLIGLSTIITIYIGGQKVFTGEITTGIIAEFILYVNMLTWPVASIGWVTSIVQRAAASQTRINEFMQTEPKILDNQDGAAEVEGKIRFENVSFTYPDTGIKAIKDVSFEVNEGESLAIVGHTGSGKSTIAALLCRLYDADSGHIYFGNHHIKDINLKALRLSIGYVPQEVFLFSDTITNNIAFGLARFDGKEEELNRIYQAAKDADIYENIMRFPDGFETRVGERGVTLSGGQKQRISIARAIIRNPSILIFDDCLSAVDTETEERILESLKSIMKGKTSIIISHRISSVKHCDKIIVLENGHISESGNHDDLMIKKGIYYELYQKQLSEEAQQVSGSE
ncbi:MAG: ABC transporter ATP-binding protein [Flavobacteriales bacterium]